MRNARSYTTFLFALLFTFLIIPIAAESLKAQADFGSTLIHFTPNPSGNGRAVAFDPATGMLYYTIGGSTDIFITNAYNTTSSLINPGITCGALSWDAKRGVLWCGADNGSGDVYTIDPNSGTKTFAFSFAFPVGDSCYAQTQPPGFIDGLAYDEGLTTSDTDDTLWLSDDAGHTLFHVDLNGNEVGQYTVPPDPQSGNPGCNTGIAVGGPFLWLALQSGPNLAPYDIVKVGKSDPTKVLLSFPFGNTNLPGPEGLAIDNDTFSNTLALWTNEFGSSNELKLWDISPLPSATLGSCTTANPCASSAEPVDTENGNYFYHHTDFVLPGRGLPIVFTRSYNTLDHYSGPLGLNWTDSYNIVLTQTTSGLVSIKWGDGHGETFTLSGSVYVPQPGVFSTLVKNADGSFVLTKKNQTKYFFAASGKLTSIVDKNSNAISLTYDASGNLTTITNAGGRSLDLTYGAGNRIVQITDPLGRTERFSYDGNNNLLTATDPVNGTTTFAYDVDHRVTSITLPNGNILLKNAYDSQGRVTSQTNGRSFTWTFAYDTPNPGETTITDPKGNKTFHTYDSQLRVVKIADTLGGTISYTYDGNNDRTSITNQDGKTTQFAYDGHGNITGITDALNDTTTFTYDTKNDLLTATNPKDKTTTLSYDANGNLLSIKDALGGTTTFTYDGTGELTSKTDADAHTTTYGYDTHGDLTRATDAVADATHLRYDRIGRLVSLTDPNGHTAHAAYDALSRLTEISDPLGDASKFQYDAIGNLTKTTDADGNATSYVYDAATNLVAVTDGMGHVTRYGYDADNNRVSFENADGNATSYAYDAINRLVTVTDPLSFVTRYSYDSVGNVVAVKDANGKTNDFTYDALNRMIGISYADGKNVTYSYDADGNRTSMVDAHGKITYAYDALDRVISVTNPGGAKVGYSYDAVGNRSTLTYPNGNVVHYGYDAANRLSSLTDWFGRVTNYRYDQASNLLSENYPNGAAVSFAYDSANRLTQVLNTYRGGTGSPISNFSYVLDPVGNRVQVTHHGSGVTRYGYNPLNELTSVSVGGKVTSYTYDPVGNRLTLTAPGKSIRYTYDSDDRLLSAGNTTFAYDANGNRIKETNSIGTVSYAYDSANRPTSVSGAGESGTFVYDGDGNRISQSLGIETYNYLNDIATAQPEVLQESGPDGDISYVYGLGRVSETSSTFDYFYQYDGLGTVVGLTEANGKLAGRYTYDAWGNAVLATPDNHIGTENKFRFTGEALDPGTGLYYLRARYYDPSAGIFLNQDPLLGHADQPGTMQRYLYALDNPVRLSDPMGLSPLEPGQLSPSANLTNYVEGAFTQIGQNVAENLVRPVGVELSFHGVPIAPSTVGRIAAYTPLLGPVLSVVQSTQDATNHPERSVLEDLQRGSISLAVSTVTTLGTVLSGALYPPAAFGFWSFGVYYDVNRENLQNQILDQWGGWLTNLFSAQPAF